MPDCSPNAEGFLFECCGLICDGVDVGSPITEWSYSFEGVIFPGLQSIGSPVSGPLTPGRWHYVLELNATPENLFSTEISFETVHLPTGQFARQVAFVAKGNQQTGPIRIEDFVTIPYDLTPRDPKCRAFVLVAFSGLNHGTAPFMAGNNITAEFAPLP